MLAIDHSFGFGPSILTSRNSSGPFRRRLMRLARSIRTGAPIGSHGGSCRACLCAAAVAREY